jgi:hypothetical protein
MGLIDRTDADFVIAWRQRPEWQATLEFMTDRGFVSVDV